MPLDLQKILSYTKNDHPEENGRKRLMLIDGWNIMIGINAVSNILDQNTMQVGMYLGTLNMVRSFVDKFKPSKIVFALDGPQAGERRRKLYSGYKAGRRVKAKSSSVIIKEGEEADDYTKYTSQGAFTFQMQRIYEFMKHLPISVGVVPYCEGDDLITHLALKNKDEFDVYIVSGDKDYCQLIDEHVFVYDWRKKVLFNTDRFLETYKVLPKNYIYMKILLGDDSDEVKGVKGIGDKTFPIFHECLSNPDLNFDNAGEFVEHVKEMDLSALDTRKRNAVKTLWKEETMEEMNLLSRVMRLDENVLKLHHIDMLRAQMEEQEPKHCSRISANVVMLKHQFNKLYNGFNNDKWLQPFMFVKPNVKIKV